MFSGSVVPLVCNWAGLQTMLCSYSWLVGPQAVLIKWMVPLAGLHVQAGTGALIHGQTGPYIVLCNQSEHQAVL